MVAGSSPSSHQIHVWLVTIGEGFDLFLPLLVDEAERDALGDRVHLRVHRRCKIIIDGVEAKRPRTHRCSGPLLS